MQKKAKHIRQMQDTDLPRLKAQLADVKDIFKGKECKALEQEIQKLEQTIREELDALPTILEEDGYPDVQAFTATYRKAKRSSVSITVTLSSGNGWCRRRNGPQKSRRRNKVSGISFAGSKRKAGRNPGAERTTMNGNFDNKKHTAQRMDFRWRCLHKSAAA